MSDNFRQYAYGTVATIATIGTILKTPSINVLSGDPQTTSTLALVFAMLLTVETLANIESDDE